MRPISTFLAALLALPFTGCGGLPPQAVQPAAAPPLGDTAGTTLGRAIAPELAAHPGQSGFHPLSDGADAFVARLALARAAERSLDVQYYIFFDDETGRALLGELLHAAERGVRVRLLLDDIHLKGKDEALAVLAAQPNFSVRVFNPFSHRSARWLDLVSDFSRVNRRMHNKAFIADNQAAIVGGRNIGDSYFAACPEADFSDLDVLGLGPVVGKVEEVFEQYWNSSVTYPIGALHPEVPDAATQLRYREEFQRRLEEIKATPYARGLADTDLARQLRERQLSPYWGAAYVIADRPEKVILPKEDESTHALPQLDQFLGDATAELLLVSPYFVPGDKGTRTLVDTARRGVRVRILTNSYMATDVGAVHAGYSGYREELLAGGVQIYELKPTAKSAQSKKSGKGQASSRASLHAKTYMVDTERLFVGSLNLDPRSARLNTEMGVILESAPLCTRFRKSFDAQILDVAYRVELDPGTGDLAWVTHEQGEETRVTKEPGVGALDRCGLFFLRVLPVEQHL